MKLMFSLAVVTRKDQTVEELLRKYINCKEDLELCIKEQRNFISGIQFGYLDSGYDSRALLIKDKKDENCWVYSAKIKEVEWQKMVDLENEELKKEGLNVEKQGVNLEKRFGFTNAIITPDGNWYGMKPYNLVSMGFVGDECKEYIKKYYTQYIKPYEKDNGRITILTCNI